MTSGEAPGTGTLRRAVALLRPYRNDTLLLLVSSVVYSLLAVANPLLTKVVFDQALFPCRAADRHLGLLVAAGRADDRDRRSSAALLGDAADVPRRAVIGQHVMHDLRERLYRHLQRDVAALLHDRRAAGEIQARITQDVAGVRQRRQRETAPSVLGRTCVFVVASLVAMAMLSWQLTLALDRRRSRRSSTSPTVSAASAGGSRAQTQEALAEMSVITEETLSVSGVLLTQGLRPRRRRGRALRHGEPAARRARDPQADGRAQLIWALAQTFFLDRAGARLPRRRVRSAAGSSPASRRARSSPFTALQTRLFLPVRELMERSIAGAVVARAVRAGLPVPRPLARDRRRAEGAGDAARIASR